MPASNSIFAKFRHSFFPLDIEDPIELNLVQVANYVLLTALSISSCMFIYYLIQGDWFLAVSTGIAMSISVFSKYLLYLRKVRLVYIILIVGTYLLAASGTLYNQGIKDIGVQSFYPILITTAVIFQPKWFKILGAFTILWFIVAYILETQGFYAEIGRAHV